MDDFVQTWRRRAVELTESEFTSPLWRDFQDALLCAQEGDFESVKEWVDETESNFVSIYEAHEKGDQQEDVSELNEYALLAQTFLLEGVENWLEALSELREGDSAHGAFSKAQWGQRLLVILHQIEKETPSVSLETWGF